MCKYTDIVSREYISIAKGVVSAECDAAAFCDEHRNPVERVRGLPRVQQIRLRNQYADSKTHSGQDKRTGRAAACAVPIADIQRSVLAGQHPGRSNKRKAE